LELDGAPLAINRAPAGSHALSEVHFKPCENSPRSRRSVDVARVPVSPDAGETRLEHYFWNTKRLSTYKETRNDLRGAPEDHLIFLCDHIPHFLRFVRLPLHSNIKTLLK